MKPITTISALIILISSTGLYIDIRASRLSDKEESEEEEVAYAQPCSEDDDEKQQGHEDLDNRKANLQLLRYIEIGNVKKAEEMLDNGASAAAVFEDGHSALHYAVKQKCPSMVRLLIDRGALSSEEDRQSHAYLLQEVTGSSQDGKYQIPIMILLVKAKIDPNATHISGSTALETVHVDRLDRVLLLLASEATYTENGGRYGMSPFEYAAWTCHADFNNIVFELMRHKAQLFVAAGAVNACNWDVEHDNMPEKIKSLFKRKPEIKTYFTAEGEVGYSRITHPFLRDKDLFWLYQQTVQVKDLVKKEDEYSVDDRKITWYVGEEVKKLILDCTVFPDAIANLVQDYCYSTDSRFIFDDMERQVQEAFDSETIGDFKYRRLRCVEVEALKEELASLGTQLDERVEFFAPWLMMQRIKENKEKKAE